MNFMIRCRDVARNISDAREGRLQGWARAKTLMHLALCSACRGYKKDIDSIGAAAQSAAGAKTTDRLSDEAKDRLRDRLDQDRLDPK